MESFISTFGYIGLFLVSFLAATIFPLGSEGAVAYMSMAGFGFVSILLVATTGNLLGALVNYGMGRWGGALILSRYIRVDDAKLKSAERVFGKWGSPALFFAWLPIIGDPLTIAAGVLKVRLSIFFFWVTIGKALRYYFVLSGVELITG